jgi:hypothetical protein
VALGPLLQIAIAKSDILYACSAVHARWTNPKLFNSIPRGQNAKITAWHTNKIVLLGRKSLCHKSALSHTSCAWFSSRIKVCCTLCCIPWLWS